MPLRSRLRRARLALRIPTHLLPHLLPHLYPISTLSLRYLEVAIEAWDPELLVLLGPGAALGGAIGQVLARMGWRGIDCKAAFTRAQRSARPALITL